MAELTTLHATRWKNKSDGMSYTVLAIVRDWRYPNTWFWVVFTKNDPCLQFESTCKFFLPIGVFVEEFLIDFGDAGSRFATEQELLNAFCIVREEVDAS